MSIPLIQALLKKEGVSGWLFYDYHGSNSFMPKILGYEPNQHITRRVFYYVPTIGTPYRLVSKVEPSVLSFLEGDCKTYLSLEELTKELKKFSGTTVAMEYSKGVPALSMVDGGTIDFLKSLDIDIVSSGNLLQQLTSVLDEEKIASHKRAMAVIEEIHSELFQWLRGVFIKKEYVFEKDVMDYLLMKIQDKGCITQYEPIVAVGKNSANPHYRPRGKGSKLDGSEICMVDMWCKEKKDGSVYADVTKMLIGRELKKEEEKVFFAVKGAADVAIAYMMGTADRRGCDVDKVAKKVLEEAGYGKYICHRLGHSITEDLHGFGANLDSFETVDERTLLPNTICSVEPGVYIPGAFGIRLECNVLIKERGIVITGGKQDSVIIL